MFTNSINHLQKNIHSTFINRITIIALLISILFTFNTLYFQSIGKGISLYSGLYQITVLSQIVEVLLLTIGFSILLGWPFLLLNKNCFLRKTNRENIVALDRYGSLWFWNGSTSKAGKARFAQTQKVKSTGTGAISKSNQNFSDQYSLIAIFSILGGSLLMSSLDLLSMYLSIELQSFALYILATLDKERLSATSAGLKYFLLGSLSSCFILLGSAIIYSYTGLTQFEAINSLISTPYLSPALPTVVPFPSGEATGVLSTLGLELVRPGLIEMLEIKKAFIIGLIIIFIGFLFKISAAPFYQWAPDVYDGTPTIVTVWLTIVVKLTILVFLQELIEFTLPETIALMKSYLNTLEDEVFFLTSYNQALGAFITGMDVIGQIQIKNLLLISSLLSLLVGTIAGLSQIKVKRLLAFSSISHVGFLLLALGIYTQKSIDSFIFYLIQYSVTSLNIFLILLAFGYLLFNYRKTLFLTLSRNAIKETEIVAQFKARIENKDNSITASAAPHADINYLVELKGQLLKNPVLSISLAICLFSMAGIPPLIGFFSKQFVLFSSIENGNNFLSVLAILVSVISASYYLRLIKITFFDSLEKTESLEPLSKVASYPALGWEEEGEKKVSPLAKLSFGAFGVFGHFEGSKTHQSKQTVGNLLGIKEEQKQEEIIITLSKAHSYIIAILTFLILFFFLDPSILLNGTQLISLTIFNI
jgi:NADH-ubiquinone oxidoreductase chain 2